MAHRSLIHRPRVAGLLLALAPTGTVLGGCGGHAATEPSDDSSSAMGNEALAGAEPAAGILPPAPIDDGSAPSQHVPPSEPAHDELPSELIGQAIRVSPSEPGSEASLFVEVSPLGTSLEVREARERICVQGEVGVVPNGDYANYWGGEVGLALVADPTTAASDTEALHARGFAFALTGVLPPELRLRVGASGEVPLYSQYCEHVPLRTGEPIRLDLRELTYECWNADGQPFPAAAGATLVSWQIPANEWSSGSFDFCIADILALE